jgi:hypothetical protein
VDRNSPFRIELERFARELNEDFPQLLARVATTSMDLIDRHYLVTCPWPFRDRNTTMLTVVDRFTDAEVLLRERASVKTAAELRGVLEDFAMNSAFPITLSRYAEDCGAPVEGWLRFKGYRKLSSDDALLLVPPEVQRELAESARAGGGQAFDQTFELVPLTTRGFTGYQAIQYLDFESGGFVVQLPDVASHTRAGNRVRIVGTIVDDKTLPRELPE